LADQGIATKRAGLLKLDVQGAEYRVLKGGANTLRKETNGTRSHVPAGCSVAEKKAVAAASDYKCPPRR
jgi:methyltransferase FkbM-like protein